MKKIKKAVSEFKPMSNPVSESDILSVYHGKMNHCRCGCGGEYYYSSANIQFASVDRGGDVDSNDINDSMISKAVKHINKNIAKATVLSGYIYEIALSGGKCYTLYAKEFNQYKRNEAGKLVYVEGTRKK